MGTGWSIREAASGRAQVLDYLVRYTHRVAISNERILDCDQEQVRIRARDNRTGGKRTVTLCQPPSSSAASCATCCPSVSSASANTCFSPQTRSRRVSRRRVRPGRCPSRNRQQSKRLKRSSSASAATTHAAVRTAIEGTGAQWPRCPRRPAVATGHCEADQVQRRHCQRRPMSTARDPLRAVSGQGSETLQEQRRAARNSPGDCHACKAQPPLDPSDCNHGDSRYPLRMSRA